MRYIFRTIRRFFASLGLVEQSQVVASTAVIVAMVTIVTTHFVSGYGLRWIDFISVVTVGVIGFFSVYFSLKYGRMLEEQRRELLELNTIGRRSPSRRLRVDLSQRRPRVDAQAC